MARTVFGESASRAPCRLVVIDEKPLFRQGLTALFAKVDDFEVALEASSSDEAIQVGNRISVDIILVDFVNLFIDLESNEEMKCPPVLGALRAAFPQSRFVLVDESAREHRIRQVLQWGFDGYITKNDSFGDMLTILRAVARGERRVSAPASLWNIETEKDDAPSPTGNIRRLTSRELEVLTYLARGMTVKGCSEALNVTANTIVNHKANIMKKLGVHKTMELLRIAIREGLVAV